MAKEKEDGKKNFPQTEMPRFSLEEVIKVAEALRDNFAGSGASGIDLAKALDKSPTSSSWRILTGSAVAYGVTSAAYNSSSISLTPLGRQIVQPTSEGDDLNGKLTALMKPSVLREFYSKYDGARVPKDDIAKNVLISMGVPQERADEALRIAIKNAAYLGILTTVGDGQFVQLKSASVTQPSPMSSLVHAPQQAKVPGLVPARIIAQENINEFSGMEKFPIAGGKLVILMPSDFKDKLLDTDDAPELDKAWKAARIALKELAKYIPDAIETVAKAVETSVIEEDTEEDVL